MSRFVKIDLEQHECAAVAELCEAFDQYVRSQPTRFVGVDIDATRAALNSVRFKMSVAEELFSGGKPSVITQVGRLPRKPS